jgi:hypothetical protein
VSSPLRQALLALALALPVTAIPTMPSTARADEPAPAKSDEASARFKAGVTFYKDKDFAAALVEFKRAYELSPNYNVLFNLGQTARELKDYAAALSAFDQYLRDGGAKVSTPRRKEVTLAVEELRHKVGKLKIVVSVDGAEILIDDAPAGVSPLAEPVVVNAGRRKLSARSNGYTPAQRMVDVPSQEETAVTLDLPKIETAPPRVDSPTPPPLVPSKPGPSLGAWVTLSATGALLVATCVTGGLAVSAHGNLDSALGTFPGNPATISAAQSKTKTLAVTTDVLIGFTAAAAVGTGVFFFVVPRLSERAQVGIGPGSVAVRGAF